MMNNQNIPLSSYWDAYRSYSYGNYSYSWSQLNNLNSLNENSQNKDYTFLINEMLVNHVPQSSQSKNSLPWYIFSSPDTYTWERGAEGNKQKLFSDRRLAQSYGHNEYYRWYGLPQQIFRFPAFEQNPQKSYTSGLFTSQVKKRVPGFQVNHEKCINEKCNETQAKHSTRRRDSSHSSPKRRLILPVYPYALNDENKSWYFINSYNPYYNGKSSDDKDVKATKKDLESKRNFEGTLNKDSQEFNKSAYTESATVTKVNFKVLEKNMDKNQFVPMINEMKVELAKSGVLEEKIPTEINTNTQNIGLMVGLGILLFVAIAAITYGFWKKYGKSGRKLTKWRKIHGMLNDYMQEPHIRYYQKTDEWKIAENSVVVNFDAKLGSGAFCNVYKGKIMGEAPICKMNLPLVTARLFRDCECAAKVLPEFASDIARSDFMQEINFMKTLRYHAHLVSMLGWVDDEKSPMLLVEYCERGDLLHLLRKKKQEIIQGYENGSDLKIKDLVSFGWQISNGLEYLSNIGCIHRDIAARNILVDAAYVAKIGDFGLCRLPDFQLYTSRGGRLPLRWMAPESLETYEYSHKSDVWSYGVLLYEIFSFGEIPYSQVHSSDLLEYLKLGKRLCRPDFCPYEIYLLMLRCWDVDPAERPSFTTICSSLAAILESATANYGYIAATEEYQFMS